MSITAMSWAWKIDAPATEKYLLLALCDHANDEDFTCYPSLTHLSKKTGLNRSSVWRLLERLISLGLLERVGTYTGKYTTNTLYRVAVGSCPQQLVAQRNQLHTATRVVAHSNQGSCTVQPGVVAQGVQESSYKPSLTISESSGGEPAITLPLNDKTEFPITPTQVNEFTGLYPAVDVEQQLRNMRGWLISNPTKRKTKAGILRFVTAWLSREQDRGRAPPSHGPPGKPGKINQAIDAFKRAGMLKDDDRNRSDERSYPDAGKKSGLLAKSG